MNSNTIAKGIFKGIMLLACAFLLLYFLYLTRSVLAYFFLSVFFSLIGRPIVLFLEFKLRFPRLLATCVAILLLFTLLVGLVWLFIPLLTEQGEKLALLDFKYMQSELKLFFQELTSDSKASKNIVENMVDEVDIEETMKKEIDTGFLPKLFNSILEVISAMSISIFSIIFISFFLLKDTQAIQSGFVKLFPDVYRSRIMNSIDSTRELLSRYFIGLLLQIFILFTIYALTLTLVGIEHPLALAFLCALFNIIPYIGPVIGAIFMVVFSVTSNLGLDFGTIILPKLGYVFIGIVVGQLIDNFISQPFIFSNSVKSHPLEIFLIIILVGLLFGVVGMIIAVPSYTVLKILGREFFPESRIVKQFTSRF
jgi:predicted PurR-regulated permease PerM